MGSLASLSSYERWRQTSKPAPERPLVRKRRRCLMCGYGFDSRHIGERICPPCKTTEQWRSDGGI